MQRFESHAASEDAGTSAVMPWKARVQRYLGRLQEAQLYAEQGLREEAEGILRDTLDELEATYLPELEKRNLRLKFSSSLKDLGRGSLFTCSAEEPLPGDADLCESSQMFAYGQVLMDGGFWDDALRYFKQVATVGHRVLESWELCGDCAARMEAWDEAIRYYETLYTNPLVPEVNKQPLLHKITTCSLAQKHASSRPKRKEESIPAECCTPVMTTGGLSPSAEGVHTGAMAGLDHSEASRLIGRSFHSWGDQRGAYLCGARHSYRILNLLYVGMTYTVFEIEAEDTGKHYAGQVLNAPFSRLLSPEVLAHRAYELKMTDSPYLVRTYDLAFLESTCMVVREHLPLSLGELLSNNGALPVWLAVTLAHQIIEGLGYLHLHMGRDKEIRKIYHLDLRPSRVLLDCERGMVKICNGGMWADMERANQAETALRKLPLAFLRYRAPEQFRSYLGRRKPPAFTDIYLFGTVFYEMLTGNAAFHAASYEEYEIQHCDQYPTPPKVWRPEISEELNDLIMNCLENDPLKRWRSATQLSLVLEKLMSGYSGCAEGPFASFARMKHLRPA